MEQLRDVLCIDMMMLKDEQVFALVVADRMEMIKITQGSNNQKKKNENNKTLNKWPLE